MSARDLSFGRPEAFRDARSSRCQDVTPEEPCPDLPAAARPWPAAVLLVVAVAPFAWLRPIVFALVFFVGPFAAAFSVATVFRVVATFFAALVFFAPALVPALGASTVPAR